MNNLYYVDITVDFYSDRMTIFSEIVSFLHNNLMNEKFAIDFPFFHESDEENTIRENAQTAQAGKLLRVFSNNQIILNKLIEDKNFKTLVEIDVLEMTAIKNVKDNSIKGLVSLERDATDLKIAKYFSKIKNKNFTTFENENFCKEKIKNLRENQKKLEKNTVYLKMSSKRSKKSFSLFIKRKVVENIDLNKNIFDPTSYGLSTKTKIVLLPYF